MFWKVCVDVIREKKVVIVIDMCRNNYKKYWLLGLVNIERISDYYKIWLIRVLVRMNL